MHLRYAALRTAYIIWVIKMDDELVVDINCVEHTYAGGVKVDICGKEFKVKRGERLAVLGANGSGKSTLLKHILGLIVPNSGRVTVFGKDPARQYDEIRSRIGTVMQNVDEQLIGPTVFDDIAFSALNFGLPRAETHRRVEAILHALNIYDLRNRLPHYLSGGERKKVALAGALVFKPELLILDEPMEGIDYASGREIAGFLGALHKETGMTMISTIHDMNVVSNLADKGYVMKHGGKLDLYGTITGLFFNHDLGDYNLAPPPVVTLIKELRLKGFDLHSTLDLNNLCSQITAILESRLHP
ncbi:MAG TPA: ABC transporter [Armatimonadetes bacterium]|nr:ABC transporter [Armatimonadota bacterium]